MVDVRFFGAHDRAWVHYKECYLFSEKDPNTFKQKRYDIEKCVAVSPRQPVMDSSVNIFSFQELNIYIENLRKVYGEFRYAPYKTTLDPENEMKQLLIFLPKYRSVPSRKKHHNRNEKVNSMEDKKEKKGAPVNSDVKDDNKNNSSQKNMEEDKTEPTQKQDTTEPEKTPVDVKNKDPDINQNGSEVNVNGCDSSYSHSKFTDDAIMEGYGTDDDANTEIDLERRKHFIGKNAEKTKEKSEEVMQEEEEEDDTQVPSNISVDASQIEDSERKQGKISLTGSVIYFLITEKISIPRDISK